MRHPLFLALTLALAACGSGNTYADADLLKNPLYAEFYYDDLVETMVNLQLNDPKVKDDARLMDILDNVRQKGLQASTVANKAQEAGTKGNLVQVALFAQGEVLYADKTVYFGPDFSIAPGPSLHIFLSKMVDPRDVAEFPTVDDVDIGLLRSPYGVQQYTTPELDAAAYRTLAIYDTQLKRLYAFAQLAQ